MDRAAGTPRRVTTQDIADKLGLSKATVSRALTGRAQVSEDTRDKVLQKAQELGYRPDPTLRALSSLRWSQHPEARATYRIALVTLDWMKQPTKTKSHVDPSHLGVFERAAELGLEVDSLQVKGAANLMSFGKSLYHRGYDAILFGMRCPVEDWKFPYEKFPCIAISAMHPALRIHQVTSDWFNAVSIAIEEVLGRGYRRPAFAFYRRRNPGIDERIFAAMVNGRRRFQQQLGSMPSIFEYPPEILDEPDSEYYERDRARFLDWYRAERPDVIIDAGFFTYWWLGDAKIAVPEEVGNLRLMRPWSEESVHVSAINHNFHQQGRTAIDILYNLIQTGSRGSPSHPMRITIACEMADGDTLPPR